jgi:3-dehydroquinate synthase
MGRIISQKTVQSSRFPYDVIVGEQILNAVYDVEAYKNADKIAVIVSSKVLSLHRKKITAVFKPAKHLFITVKDGESSKEITGLVKIVEKMMKGGCSRSSCIVAIGGGVIGDLAGFVAAIYMRGIPVIHVPTTLLAMVDSSIGGKTGININKGKNIAGAFYPPSAVIQDITFLKTLPDREFRNGLSECVKHAFIGEQKLMALFKSSGFEDLKSGDNLAELVVLSSGFKIEVVSRDEKESGERAILNFGHTIGHAIETAKKYALPHGAAVAHGMIVVAHISRELGMLSEHECRIIESVIEKFKLAPSIQYPPVSELLKHMTYDKKNSAGTVRFVLLKEIFHPIYNIGVDMQLVKRELSRLYHPGA